jgi:glyoxylase-like metal-dependent hydrolase (beta-lactamase superfamily II)
MAPKSAVCEVLNTGWATAPEWILLRGGGRSQMRVPALVALIRHPRHGWGLFDTGYAPRVPQALTVWPFVAYRWVAPMTVASAGAVAAQLPRFGLTAGDIAWIVVSHFHADHVGGLEDFPRARFIASRSAYDDIRTRTGCSALRRAFVPSLMPRDFESRATLLDGLDGPDRPALARAHDLFGDGLIMLYNLPGHARGQIGALVRTTTWNVFLVADGCWLSQAFRENRPPHRVTGVFVDSVRAAARTVAVLHEYAAAHPDTAIVPSHCPEAYARHVGRGAA